MFIIIVMSIVTTRLPATLTCVCVCCCSFHIFGRRYVQYFQSLKSLFTVTCSPPAFEVILIQIESADLNNLFFLKIVLFFFFKKKKMAARRRFQLVPPVSYAKHVTCRPEINSFTLFTSSSRRPRTSFFYNFFFFLNKKRKLLNPRSRSQSRAETFEFPPERAAEEKRNCN